MSGNYDPYADVVVGLDLSDTYVELAELERESERVKQAVVTNIRIAAQTTIYLASAISGTLSQMYALLAEAIIVSLELGFALYGGTFGVANAFQLGQLIFMAQTIKLIHQKDAEQVAKTQQFTNVLRLASTIRW